MSSATTSSLADPPTFLHTLAILISRSLNTLNPNDVLATRVYALSTTLSYSAFASALSTFGKFTPAQSKEIFDACQAQDVLDKAFKPPGGMVITDSDVMAGESGGRGGLGGGGDKHVFKAPAAGPARTSALGLDRLADEKRREKAGVSTAVKRIRYDEDDEPAGGDFKSESTLAAKGRTGADRVRGAAPSRPVPGNIRPKADETPSHPGGLSETARARLAEHRAKKVRPDGVVDSRFERDRDETGKKAMGEFRERLNKNDQGGRRGGSRKDWDEEGRSRDDRNYDGGRQRDSGWGRQGERMGGNDHRDRDDGRTPSRKVYDTPSGSDPTASRIKNQGWESTPSGSRNAPPSRPHSWDSTPRSVAGTPARTDRGSDRGTKGEWDTPRRVPTGYGDESPGPLPPPSSGLDEKEWEEEQMKLDRAWYNTDEQGGEADDAFGGYDDYDKEKEVELIRRANGGAAGPKKKVSARQAAFNAENELWEDNRLALSGVTGQRRKLDFDTLDDDEETRVHLLVHDLKPPFLDGRLAFTKQLDPINPIKDPTSDLAVFAKKGSLLVMERRAQKEREKVSRRGLPPACIY
jgi:pre-mRNA-splicing factor ATP-dependent RNA helicase DHX38/PRP16